MDFAINIHGSFTKWVSTKNENIFYPSGMVMVAGVYKRRGLGHICFPYGDVSDDPRFEGMSIPKHGPIRIGNYASGVITGGTKENKVTGHFTVAGQLPVHHVGVEISENVNDGVSVLKHTMHISNDINSEESLNLLAGLHLYFTTHGEQFFMETCEDGDRKIFDTETLSKSFYVPNSPNGFVLHTSEGRTHIYVSGYDGYVVWTDCRGKYVCIEPVVGLDEHFLRSLEPNDIWFGECVITHTPN